MNLSDVSKSTRTVIGSSSRPRMASSTPIRDCVALGRYNQGREAEVGIRTTETIINVWAAIHWILLLALQVTTAVGIRTTETIINVGHNSLGYYY